jgi:hypothetical protein
MMQRPLIRDESPVALRQPKTDRLVLGHWLTDALDDKRLDEDAIQVIHEILLKWAELASQLATPYGRVGILTPSGIASDKTTNHFFIAVAETAIG